MRYAIVIEKAVVTYPAYGPVRPGRIAAGATAGRVEDAIREAIRFPIDGSREDGEPITEPVSRVACVEA